MSKVQAQVKNLGEVLSRSYMIVSDRHVDYEELNAFEAASIAAVAVMAVTVGVLQSTLIA